MSHHQPPPGPYGGQPQQPGQPAQPGPYGAPAPQQPAGPPAPPSYGPGSGPGQPGYGYPQGQPGYGPPGAYGGQPGGYGQGGQPPYGQPGMPGTPGPTQGGGSNKGKTIGIIAAAVVVVAAVVGGAFMFAGDDGDSSETVAQDKDKDKDKNKDGGGDGGDNDNAKDDGDGSDGGPRALTPYKVVPPPSLLNGEYTKDGSRADREETDTEDLADDSETLQMGITDGTGVTATYASAGKESLQFNSVYGKVADPEATADKVFARIHKNQQETGKSVENYTLKTVEKAKDYSPEGFNGEVLRCETKRQTGDVGSTSLDITFSVCVWTDEHAVGIVQSRGAEPADGKGTYGDPMGQNRLAEETVAIRKEAMQPAGSR